MTEVLYVAIGFLSGIISGMGIGGGVVLIPALTLFMGFNQQAAQNINLIYFVPTAVIALFTHVKKGNVEKGLLLPIILAGLVSAAAGAFLAVNLDSKLLRKLFGFFLIFMGIVEFMKKDKNDKSDRQD